MDSSSTDLRPIGTNYADKGKKPESGKFLNFDHVEWWVGNAMQAASFYCTRMGFEYLGYRGLETGDRQMASHAVRQNQIIFVFKSSYDPDSQSTRVMGNHLAKHGDGVKDVAFTVDDIDAIVERAAERGATVLQPVTTEWAVDRTEGYVRFAKLQTFGDTTHTLVDRAHFTGLFLPGYEKPRINDALLPKLPNSGLRYIDHCVGNQPDLQMEDVAKW